MSTVAAVLPATPKQGEGGWAARASPFAKGVPAGRFAQRSGYSVTVSHQAGRPMMPSVFRSRQVWAFPPAANGTR